MVNVVFKTTYEERIKQCKEYAQPDGSGYTRCFPLSGGTFNCGRCHPDDVYYETRIVNDTILMDAEEFKLRMEFNEDFKESIKAFTFQR